MLANLHRRKVVQSPLCSNCNRAKETVQHALWDYDQVLGCWGYRFKKLRNSEQSMGVFADLVFSARQQDVNMELFMVTAWMIWSRRNKKHFNEQHQPPEKITEAAAALLAEFHGNSAGRSDRKQIGRASCRERV